MHNGDLLYLIEWWIYLLVVGLLFLPLSSSVFGRLFDKGYIFAKTLGIAILSYSVFILGTFHILPFERVTIFLLIILLFIGNVYFLKRRKLSLQKSDIGIFIFQECLFLFCLIAWALVKSFQPEIHGLEKFMDFGFMNSILRSNYFPPVDMWFPPDSINYYYFGHLATAVLIKLTSIPGYIAYNLMLSTIFAFTVTSAFSIVSSITQAIIKIKKTSIFTGLLAGIITALGGNLQTIYTFFVPYNPPENPVPFWQLKFNFAHFVGTGSAQKLIFDFPNSYWYPNATRFIPFTIHEFPSYSFVVSDLHGHVLDIPFVFLTLALILTIFLSKKITYKITGLIGFFLSVMYMTNAWDGIIYFGLFFMTVLLLKSDILKTKKKSKIQWFHVRKYLRSVTNKSKYLIESFKLIAFGGICYILFTLPFNLNFKPFVSGIGVLCAPDFLIKVGKIGPFLFEANHCQRSPLWMLIILYGFFYFFATVFIIKVLRLSKTPPTILYALLLILLSTILIATPEFIYAKDIYPAHYRANTMFKLGYQAFIMLSLVSSFSIAYIFHNGKKVIWLPITFFLLTLILIYPYFAVTSYFNNFKTYQGLDGLAYLKTSAPDDLDAINWIQENIKDQPVMLEAQGDSYTDYERISANTGLPTPLGWTVHEWLWRGSYSFPESRLEDIKNLYEGDINQTRLLIQKYKIKYVYIGTLEKTKYPNLNETKFENLGMKVYQKGTVSIYQL